MIEDRQGVCDTCPSVGECAKTPTLFFQLIQDGEQLGYLFAALDHDLKVDEEERSLFAEMAGDLAYALNFFRVEAENKSFESKRKSLEGQLIQAQKMESVGRLAGGVAHDYNNISSIIIGYAELALEKVAQGDPLHDDLMEIFTAAKRSTDITRQLLAFARRQTIKPQVLNLNDSMEKMLKMLRRLIAKTLISPGYPEGRWGRSKLIPPRSTRSWQISALTPGTPSPMWARLPSKQKMSISTRTTVPIMPGLFRVTMYCWP